MGSYEDKKFGVDRTITGGREFTGDFSAINELGDQRNLLINGAFDFWQRGDPISNPSNGDYVADRWWTQGASSNVEFAKVASGLPENLWAACRIRQTGAGLNSIELDQALETLDVRPLRGKTLTFSFYYKTVVDSTNGWRAYVEWGTGTDEQNPSGGATLLNVPISNSAAWVRSEHTFVVPATANSLRVAVWTDSNVVTTAQAQFAGMMLNIGDRAAPFQRAGTNIEDELSMCQRYYEIVGGVSNAPVAHGVQYTTSAGRCGVFFRTTKRANPTVTTIGSSFNFDRGGGASSTGTPSYFFHSPNSVWMEFSLAGGTQGLAILVTSSSNSAVAVDAELN